MSDRPLECELEIDYSASPNISSVCSSSAHSSELSVGLVACNRRIRYVGHRFSFTGSQYQSTER